MFRSWVNELPEMELRVANLLRYPIYSEDVGRERLEDLIESLADAFSPFLDLPLAFYGHSFGALLSFEVAREFRRRGLPGPSRLVVSAFRAPQLGLRFEPIHHLPDAEFVEAITKRYNSIPQVVLEDEELLALTLPSLRADFRLYETYAYRAEPPLDCAISALGANADQVVMKSELAAWQAQTNSSFTLEMFPGDHFFPTTNAEAVLEVIRRDAE